MAEAFIGSYIRQRREELGLTQQQLCEGICGPTTMSRLECGSQTPSRNVVNALLQRLDLPSDRYLTLLNRHETEIELLIKEIDILCIAFQHAYEPEKARIRNNAIKKVNDLEQLVGGTSKFALQFILHVKVMLGQENGFPYTYDTQLSMLLDAIHLTVPRFDLGKINNFLYCLDEIILINQIAGVYTRHGQHWEAVAIFDQLLTYIQTHHRDILDNQGHLPMVSHNYARVLNLCKQNEKALEVAEIGRQACIQYRNYQLLPRIIHMKAIIYHDLQRHEQSKQMYYQAYHICMAIDDNRDLTLLREDAREQYGIEFEH